MTNTDEDSFITITGIVSKLYFEELMDGRECFHDVEWDIQEYDEDAPLLLAEVKRLREVMIYVEQRQPHSALEWALKEGLTLAEIMERVE